MAPAPPQPVALAWVELLDARQRARAFTRADALGRFVFADVAAGEWRLRASVGAAGRKCPARYRGAGADRQLRRGVLTAPGRRTTEEKTMAVQVSYPGVYIEEFAPGAPIQGVGTSTAAFIGVAARGPLDEPIKVTSLGAVQRDVRRYSRCRASISGTRCAASSRTAAASATSCARATAAISA